MAEMSPVKAATAGTLSGLAAIPITAAICTAAANKMGNVIETVGTCAVICSVICGAVGAFVAVRLGGSLSGVVVTLIMSAILLLSAIILNSGDGMFTPSLSVLVGGCVAELILNIKKPKKKRVPKRAKRK